MKHKYSTKNLTRKLALSMQTNKERVIKGMLGSPFLSKSWEERKLATQNRIKKQIARIKIRKAEREKALKENKPVVYSIK